MFTIPLSALDTELDVAAYSIKYDKWYDRVLVFASDTIRECTQTAEDGIYEGYIESDTALDGVVTAAFGRMESEIPVEKDAQSLEINGESHEAADVVCRFALASLELRMGVCIHHTDDGRQTGWLKLGSAGLTSIRSAPNPACIPQRWKPSPTFCALPIDCRLEITQSGMTAVFTVQKNSFAYIYMGAAKDAKADEVGWIQAVPDKNGEYTYTVEIPTMDKEIALATYSEKKRCGTIVVCASIRPH